MIFSFNVVLFNLNIYFRFTGYFALTQIAYIFSAIYVFFIGYFGIRQGRIFVDIDNVETVQK